MKKSLHKLLLLFTAFALIAAACGSDSTTEAAAGGDDAAEEDGEAMADGPESINVAYFAEWPTPNQFCLLYTSPSPRDATLSRMPSSA